MSQTRKSKEERMKINSERLSYFRELYELPTIDVMVPEEIEKRVSEYFLFCEQKGLKPAVESLCLALGVHRSRFNAWRQQGGYRGEIMNKAAQMIAAITEDSGLNGGMNPAAYCFTMKNHFGYSDITEVRTQQVETMQLPSKEEIIARLPGMDVLQVEEKGGNE